MRYYVILMIVVMAGCSGQPLDLVLQNSDVDSSEIVGDLAGCYKGLVVDAENDSYFVQFSKVYVDGLSHGVCPPIWCVKI